MPVLEEQGSLVVQELKVSGYERVIKATDARAGLQAIICIHNVSLGPALGGTRMYPYSSFEEAMTDGLRLAKGMTYKAAVAGTGTGGGKSVIIGNPKEDKSEDLWGSFARALNHLQGSYICAEDLGTNVEDMRIINRHTPYIVGLPHAKSSGDPAPFTAWGTLRAIQAVLKKLYRSDDIRGRTIAIQGVGSVGAILAEMLFWQGAKLILSDVNCEAVERLAKKFHAEVVSPKEILSIPCDILAPCALGGIINGDTILKLRCKGIAGCANNQLWKDSDGEALMQQGILYAPDFVTNAGGLINVSIEIESEGYNPSSAHEKVHQIYDQLSLIFDIAEKNQCSTHRAALALGDYRLTYGIGQRVAPVYFHHSDHILKFNPPSVAK